MIMRGIKDLNAILALRIRSIQWYPTRTQPGERKGGKEMVNERSVIIVVLAAGEVKSVVGVGSLRCGR